METKEKGEGKGDQDGSDVADSHEVELKCCDIIVESKFNIPPVCEDESPSQNSCIQDEKVEVFVVVEPYTAAQPGTVVVHLQNASITHTAVVGSIRFSFKAQ